MVGQLELFLLVSRPVVLISLVLTCLHHPGNIFKLYKSTLRFLFRSYVYLLHLHYFWFTFIYLLSLKKKTHWIWVSEARFSSPALFQPRLFSPYGWWPDRWIFIYSNSLLGPGVNQKPLYFVYWDTIWITSQIRLITSPKTRCNPEEMFIYFNWWSG